MTHLCSLKPEINEWIQYTETTVQKFGIAKIAKKMFLKEVFFLNRKTLFAA